MNINNIAILAALGLLTGCMADDYVYVPVEPENFTVKQCEPLNGLDSWKYKYTWVEVHYTVTNGLATEDRVSSCLKVQ